MSGKIDKSKWEVESSAPGAPGAPPPATASGKAALFEQAARDAAPKEVKKKKTWAVSGNSGGHSNSGKYKGKTQIGDGPPPAKSLTDLP